MQPLTPEMLIKLRDKLKAQGKTFPVEIKVSTNDKTTFLGMLYEDGRLIETGQGEEPASASAVDPASEAGGGAA